VVRKTSDPTLRVLMFTLRNEWEPAVEPITHDKPTVLGVGRAWRSERRWRRRAGVTIGWVLAPLAHALEALGTRRRFVFQCRPGARLAMRDGTLKGILWHQGESDSGMSTNAISYGIAWLK